MTDHLTGLVIELLVQEIDRQDLVHPAGYPATRDGLRLALAAVWDEWDEARLAHRSERCKCPTPVCGHYTWFKTRNELIQVAAVAMRAVRSIEYPTRQGTIQ